MMGNTPPLPPGRDNDSNLSLCLPLCSQKSICSHLPLLLRGGRGTPV